MTRSRLKKPPGGKILASALIPLAHCHLFNSVNPPYDTTSMQNSGGAVMGHTHPAKCWKLLSLNALNQHYAIIDFLA